MKKIFSTTGPQVPLICFHFYIISQSTGLG